MKKKLLTLAVAAALPMATQAANAEVTIYGKIHASIDYMSADKNSVTTTTAPSTSTVTVPAGAGGTYPVVTTPGATTTVTAAGTNGSQWAVNSRATRLGFKGSEDLGNGMKMIWKIETQANIAHPGTNGFTFRNTYIGLAGNWGAFLYGRHDTPVKISTGKLDIFADTVADYNLQGSGIGTGGLVDIRANDAIAYVSPTFNGLTLIGAIVPDGNARTNRPFGLGAEPAGEVGDFAGAYSLAAMYSNGGLFLAAGYERLDKLLGIMNTTATGTTTINAKHWRIGAGYDFNNFHIGGVYQQADAALSANLRHQNANKTNDYKTFTINGSYTFGNNVVKAMWLNTKFDDGVLVYDPAAATNTYKTSFNTWAIGLDHNFSKRSKVYVIYAHSDMALNGSNYNSLTNYAAAAVPGTTIMTGAARKQGVFSLGMVHNF